MNQVSSGLVVLQDGGAVELINPAGKRLLGVSDLHHIDELSEIAPRLVARVEDRVTRQVKDQEVCFTVAVRPQS